MRFRAGLIDRQRPAEQRLGMGEFAAIGVDDRQMLQCRQVLWIGRERGPEQALGFADAPELLVMPHEGELPRASPDVPLRGAPHKDTRPPLLERLAAAERALAPQDEQA